MQYAFILGKNPTLSIAEIISVLRRERFVFVISSISINALVIKIDKELENVQDFLNDLGGTIKIAQIFSESKESDVSAPILEFITSNVKASKFVYGLSFYGLKNKNLGFEIKRYLKTKGINTRLVLGKDAALSAPEIQHNGIIEKGADFVIIKNGNDFFVGRTLAIQDYESYSHRDFDRPRRNAKSGMLPPKVAQIMINLVPTYNLQFNNLPLIYDPFCGNGTILQEALIMGLDVIGSDLSADRIYDTKINLEWLAKEYDEEINIDNILFQADALKLTKEDLPIKPDAIVSEVYLGPPMAGHESENKINSLIQDLSKDYISFLQNTYYLLPTTQFLVLALPFYISKNNTYFLNIIDEAKNLGYNTLCPIEDLDNDSNILKEYNEKRNTILYSREGQIVGREIIILERK